MNKFSKTKIRVIFLAIFFGVLFFAKSSWAATYYVSPNGTNTWPNCTTQDSPCLAGSTTAGKAFLGAVAGDTVYFLPGTYDAGDAVDWVIPAWNLYNSGSDANHQITFKKHSGTVTLLDSHNGPILGTDSAIQYVILDGFTIVKTYAEVGGQRPTRFSGGASHITIQNFDITGFNQGSSGANNACISLHTVSYVTIKNNKLHGALGAGNNNCGTMSYSVDHITVENNEIYNNNTGVYDKDGGTNNTYRYNFFHDNYGDHFLLGAESTGPNPTNIYVYQNVMLNGVNNSVDIGPGRTVSNIYVYNNTIYNSAAGSRRGILNRAQLANTFEVFNNIIYNTGIGLKYQTSATGKYSNYNDLYNYGDLMIDYDSHTITTWRSDHSLDVNSVLIDPSFVNAGGSLVTDYKRTTYPTNGRGGAYSSVIGAYITGNETIGYTPSGSFDTTPPSPPTGVTIN